MTASSFADPRAPLPELTVHDERRLRRRLHRARSLRDEDARGAALARAAAAVAAAEARLARRRAAVPALMYPEQLPVSQRKDEILAAVRDNQVVVVAGETGSGKTTQLPKICLELGRGVRGMIGHTQPRRLAARTVAARVADELGTPLGRDGVVGYQVRFGDQVGDGTLVKMMTDGILLAELASDRLLTRYDTIIVDEAHERGLNIDFILGYLRQLLPRRPDLKVVITSATIDPHRFAEHFGGAPVLEVSGRTYPVEIRYQPPEENADQVQAIIDAVNELCAEGPGDVLVFLSGEREIRDTAEALTGAVPAGTEILPLYARLASGDQNRVFTPHTGRRVVLATNVAETSLTVPGIRYVVDPGRARISRYSPRTKVQRLPIEPISQASANQRSGRCGRTSDGICVRLYSEEDFASRPAFTDPEIARTNLAAVILRMAALDLGEVAEFPFVDPPDRRAVKDGVLLLRELGALEGRRKRDNGSLVLPEAHSPGAPEGRGKRDNGSLVLPEAHSPGAPEAPEGDDARMRLTAAGRALARLPIDPRLGRMVIAAEREGCPREILVIVSGLSIQDPRERPTEAVEAADAAHARFADPASDFLALANLWRYLEERQDELSGSQFRKLCRAEFLNYQRVREWQDLRSQLLEAVTSLGMALNDDPAPPAAVHRALLAGLLSHIGRRDEEKRDYAGARGTRFAIFPGSGLGKRQPAWVMAAELVETSRLWARTAARIEPEWIESLAGHLVARFHSEPRWEARRGAVMATERVTLYGIPIVVGRPVDYARIDPALCRELFIRHALVGDEWRTHHAFAAANRRLLAEVTELEDRSRRRDLRVDDEALVAFFDARLPAEVVSARHFDSWWKTARRSTPDLLTYTRDLLVAAGASTPAATDYPDAWEVDGASFPLTYQFSPGEAADGVTVTVPLAALGGLPDDAFDWQVPGLRHDLVTALIRSLPKELRRSFVPAPNHAAEVLRRVGPADGPLLAALTRELRRMGGSGAGPDSWRMEAVPAHLRMSVRVVDGGKVVGEGRELAALRARLRPRLRAAVAAAAPELTRTGLRSWDLGTLPDVVETRASGHPVSAYPGLTDAGESVSVTLFDSAAERRRAHWAGTRRLLLLTLPSPLPYLRRHLATSSKLTLSRNPHGGVAELLADCVSAAVDRLMTDADGPAMSAEAFAALAAAVRAGINATTLDVVNGTERVLSVAHAVEAGVAALSAPAFAAGVADVSAQLAGLVHAGFVTEAGAARLPDLERYLRAVERRLEAMRRDSARDKVRTDRIARVTAAYGELLDSLPAERRADDDVTRIRWMIEELRVSFFAQNLGTPYPVSEERVLRAINAV